MSISGKLGDVARIFHITGKAPTERGCVTSARRHQIGQEERARPRSIFGTPTYTNPTKFRGADPGSMLETG